MANHCPECGKEIESADHKHCPECGRALGTSQDSTEVATPSVPRRKRHAVLIAVIVVVVLGIVAVLALGSSGRRSDTNTQTLAGVSDVVCMCEEKDDFCTFVVFFEDGTDRTYTSREAIFKVGEAGDAPEGVEVTTITEYETGPFGLSETVVGEREVYDFALEPADYEHYWSIQHAD